MNSSDVSDRDLDWILINLVSGSRSGQKSGSGLGRKNDPKNLRSEEISCLEVMDILFRAMIKEQFQCFRSRSGWDPDSMEPVDQNPGRQIDPKKSR